MKIVETERLILCPFTLDDVEDSYQLNQDPDITKYTGDGAISREDMHNIIQNVVLADYENMAMDVGQ